MGYKTKEETNAYYREYYQRNKKKQRAYHYKKNKEDRLANRDKYNEYMRLYMRRKKLSTANNDKSIV